MANWFCLLLPFPDAISCDILYYNLKALKDCEFSPKYLVPPNIVGGYIEFAMQNINFDCKTLKVIPISITLNVLILSLLTRMENLVTAYE